jgi:hypothetical protein
MPGLRRGRRGSGRGQRQVLSEDYDIAVRAFGKTFVDSHMEAIREGRTRVSLRDLARRAERKKGR